MASANRLAIFFKDHGGTVAKCVLNVVNALTDPGGVTALAIVNAIVNSSHVSAYLASISIGATDTDSPATGPRADAEDKTLMVFRDSVGRTHTMKCPGVNEAMLLTDKLGLNLSSLSLTPFRDAILANCVTADGVSFASFVGGRAIRRKLKKR